VYQRNSRDRECVAASATDMLSSCSRSVKACFRSLMAGILSVREVLIFACQG
jgi:hypothetical protein